MRISTSTLYELGVARLQTHQAEQLKLQQQIASGRRVLTPADDPIAAASALEVTQARSINEQYRVNADSARAGLALEEQALADITRLLQDVKVLTINAGNAALNDDDRASLGTELEGLYQELLGTANRTDGNGRYLFSGYQEASRPFYETAPGTVAYGGDQGQRLIQIGPSREIAVSDAGASVFLNIGSGNEDVFAALSGLAAALKGGAAAAQYQNALDAAMVNVDSALDNVLTVRASVGVRLKEVDAAQETAADLALNYDQTLSRLQDLDYAQALSELNLRQVQLEAAQKSFVMVTGSKLFDYL